MSRTILLLIFGLILKSNYCPGQCQYYNQTDSLGIGLVKYNIYNRKEPVFEVYNDRQLTESFCRWNLYKDATSPFCAKFHKPKHGIAEIVVLDTLPNAYKILINKSDIKYSPRNRDYVFLTWDEYLKHSHGTRRKTETTELKNQPIRDQANELAPIIELPNEPDELLCVIEVQNDWIKVKYDCFYNLLRNPHQSVPCSTYIDECANSVTGWLKWRNKNRVLIDIFTL